MKILHAKLFLLTHKIKRYFNKMLIKHNFEGLAPLYAFYHNKEKIADFKEYLWRSCLNLYIHNY